MQNRKAINNIEDVLFKINPSAKQDIVIIAMPEEGSLSGAKLK
jgi:hypothetical protein